MTCFLRFVIALLLNHDMQIQYLSLAVQKHKHIVVDVVAYQARLDVDQCLGKQFVVIFQLFILSFIVQ